MKYCLAAGEILRREVVVESDDPEAVEEALEKAYREGKIVLGADDLIPNALTGEPKTIMAADWYSQEEVQLMETDIAA